MAGHSKWANIKHTKARVDAKRGKIFTKLIREITVAAKLGGGDINSNPRLRLATDKALSQNMPKDTIQRAIKRGAGGEDNDNLVEARYEGYGPNGVAVMVDCLTDNKNRTVAEVRHAFSKCGGNLGTDGCVSYLFNNMGVMSFASGYDENQMMEIALEHHADDITTHDNGTIDLTCQPEHFTTLKDALIAVGITPEQAEITFIAATEVELETTEQAESMLKLTSMLEDLDDVQQVYANASIADDLLAKL